MMPPIQFAAPPTGEVPADRSPPPQVSRDTFSQACARSLKQPVIVTDIGDGALLVEPLHFFRVFAPCGQRRSAVVSNIPVHAVGGSLA